MEIDLKALDKLKGMISNELIESFLKEHLEKEKEFNAKYENPFDFEIDNKPVKLQLKKKVTPETRHRLRQILKLYPKKNIQQAITETSITNPEIKDEMELRNKTVELYPQYSLQDISDYLALGKNYVDEKYENDIDIFLMSYFQEIVSSTTDAMPIKDNPIVLDGGINPFWLKLDMETMKEAVGFFRKKVAI